MGTFNSLTSSGISLSSQLPLPQHQFPLEQCCQHQSHPSPALTRSPHALITWAIYLTVNHVLLRGICYLTLALLTRGPHVSGFSPMEIS